MRRTWPRRPYTPLLFMLGRRQPGIPGAYWNYLQKGRWILVPPCLVILVVGIISWCYLLVILWLGPHDGLTMLRERFPMIRPSWLPYLALPALALFMIVPAGMSKRYRRYAERHDYQICLNCGYALVGLPEEHACPECGTRFVIEAVRRDWKAWFAKKNIWPGGLWG